MVENELTRGSLIPSSRAAAGQSLASTDLQTTVARLRASRCPGEQLTIQAVEDFLRKVWTDKIEFEKFNIINPEILPIGPTTVIGDNVGFVRSA